MATQSKSVEKLKSEVLKTSSRPYELIEYNSDKIITGEINPDLINSNITTYEKNSDGIIIIDKNKDLSNQKMLISLNTTKISNAKFNQIIDTEFQDFVLKADTSLLFLESKLAALQAIDQQNRTSKKVNTDKIKQLQAQIVLLENQIIEMRKLGNNLPDSISYGTTLQYVKNSNVTVLGNMLLSKGRKAKARFDANGSFKVTLGNYDYTGKLLDGDEVVTFQPLFSGNIANKNLTDEEASQYLANHPDLARYFNGPTANALIYLAEIKDNPDVSQQVPFILIDDTMRTGTPLVTAASKVPARSSFNNSLSYSITQPDAGNTSAGGISKQMKQWLSEDLGRTITTAILGTGTSSYSTLSTEIPTRYNYWVSKTNDTSIAQHIRDFWRVNVYESLMLTINNNNLQLPGWQFVGDSGGIVLDKTKPNYKLVQQQLKVVRDKLAQDLIDSPSGTNFTSVIYTIPYSPSIQIPIEQLIGSNFRSNLSQKKSSNLIQDAKGHWRYVITQKPSELSFRSYLSDAQAQSYLNNYGDLQAAFGNDLLQAKQHWNYAGFNEGRTFAAGNTILQIWRSSVDKKGYIEIVTTMPWHVRWTTEYTDLSKSSRVFLDDNGILYLYDKAKIVWQSYNEDE